MDQYYHGIFFARIKILGVEQPALQIETLILPVNVFGLSPCRFEISVARGDLLPLSEGAGPDLRRCGERLPDERGGFAIGGKRNCGAPAAGGKLLRSMNERFKIAGRNLDSGHPALAINIFTKKNFCAARQPGEPAC